MLNIQGRSDLFLKLELLKKFLFIPVFIVGYFFELKFMLWSAVLYYYIEFICNSYFSERFFNYGTLKQIKDLLPVFIISIFVAFCVWCITLLSFSAIVTLLFQLIIGTIMFVICYEVYSLPEYKELKGIISKQIKLIKFSNES